MPFLILCPSRTVMPMGTEITALTGAAMVMWLTLSTTSHKVMSLGVHGNLLQTMMQGPMAMMNGLEKASGITTTNLVTTRNGMAATNGRNAAVGRITSPPASRKMATRTTTVHRMSTSSLAMELGSHKLGQIACSSNLGQNMRSVMNSNNFLPQVSGSLAPGDSRVKSNWSLMKRSKPVG